MRELKQSGTWRVEVGAGLLLLLLDSTQQTERTRRENMWTLSQYIEL